MVGSINGSMSMMNMQAMQQHHKQMFNKMDSDGNGGINESELVHFRENIGKNW